MDFPTIDTPVTHVLPTLTESIAELSTRHSGLITVLCPTNTSSVFLRRQYEQLVQSSLGVRFTTVNEVSELLEDAAQTTTLSSRSRTIAHFDTCTSIARQLFPQSSVWVKAPLVRSTLELLYSMDDEYFEQAINDYEFARLCCEAFRNTTETKKETQTTIPIEKILGQCIIINYKEPNRAHKRFASRYSEFVYTEIREVEGALHRNVAQYSTPHDEVDAVLEEFSSLENFSINKCALIVPNNEYKRLAVEIAQRKGIKLAGSSPTTIASHPFCELAKYFLTTCGQRITYEDIQRFIELFPWIKNPQGKHPFITCRDEIASSHTVGEYFTKIVQFIRDNVDATFFTEDFERAPEIELTQSAFSCLQELSESTSVLSPSEAALLLEQETSSNTLRIGALGSGLYVSLATEVFGSCFDHVFICGMNDTYISPAPIASSLIPRDQYERYEVSGKSEREQEAQNILSWLRNCAHTITMSTAEFGLDGKSVVLPHWAEVHETPAPPNMTNDFLWTDEIAQSSQHVSKLISRDLNNVNALSRVPDEMRVSATGISVLAQCPSQFFHRHVLSATTPQTTDDPDELLPMVLGTFIHQQLDNYVTQSLTAEELFENMRAHVQEMSRKGELPHNASSVLTTERLTKLLENFLTLHEQAAATSIASEVRVEKKIIDKNRSVDARGTIDRVQHTSDTTTLIDYKTGKIEDSADMFHFGRKLQLAIYALMLEDNVDDLEYWYLGGDTPDIAHIDWNDENRSQAQDMLFPISELAQTGTFIPRNEYVEVKSKTPSHSSRCSSCEVEPYCYDEQRLLWPIHKSDGQLAEYANVTGENLFEEQP